MKTTYNQPKGKGRLAVRSVFRTQMAYDVDLRLNVLIKLWGHTMYMSWLVRIASGLVDVVLLQRFCFLHSVLSPFEMNNAWRPPIINPRAREGLPYGQCLEHRWLMKTICALNFLKHWGHAIEQRVKVRRTWRTAKSPYWSPWPWPTYTLAPGTHKLNRAGRRIHHLYSFISSQSSYRTESTTQIP